MDYQEGYADGLAGAGMQDRPHIRGWLFNICEGEDDFITPDDACDYIDGHVMGSLDRKAMLAQREREGA